MSRFKGYAERLETKAREAMTKYIAAEQDFNTAQEEKSRYPLHGGTNSQEYYEKAVEAAHRANKAQKQLDEAKQAMRAALDSMQGIRRELVECLTDEFTPQGDKIKDSEVKLLESGILSPAELLQKYDVYTSIDNWTMARVCGKYAAQYAEQLHKDGKHNEAEQMLAMQIDAQRDRAGEWLERFDGLVETFSRTINNPAMIPRWHELTAPLFEQF